MSEVVNGQIVPALSQWQGTTLILAAIVIGCGVRVVRRLLEG